MPSRVRRNSAIAAMAITLIAGFEGLRQKAYLDPIGIPTACFGSTKGIKLGDYFTIAECTKLLNDEVVEHEMGMRKCLTKPDDIPDGAYVAFTSFTYNVGVGAFCKSTLARKANAGDIVGACNELLKWDRAAGIRLPGLTKRRAEERKICMRGLPA